VKHLGISTVRGTFDQYSGALYVGHDLASTVVSIEAEMRSVNSGNPYRDEHIHNADFFDVAHHPQMTFRSTSIVGAGDRYVMAGDLTIKGVTNQVAFDVTYNGEAVFPMDGSTHFGFTAAATISRTAFNMGYGVPMVSDAVALTIDVQFIRPVVEE
jgi:polyisoprenoid-binding protein YceI